MTPPLALENGGYVGAAYVVFLLLLLIYVAIMAAKLQRIQRELGSLAELADRSGSASDPGIGLEKPEPEIEAAAQEVQR